jgi:hypothetical protein
MIEGYIFMGFGKKYVDECRCAVDMLNVFDKKRPKAILTNTKDAPYAKSLNVFDDVVVIDFDKEPLLKSEKNPHNLYCVIPRILMPKYLPYEKTLALDSDIVTLYNPEQVWDFMNSKNQAFVCCGYEYEKCWHWGKIDGVISKLGKKIPSIHGGVLFFNMKHPDMEQFSNDCLEICENYDTYGCQRIFRGGMTDEVIFAIAMAKQDYLPLHYVEYPIVSFNLPPNISIPFNFHTRNGLDRATYEATQLPIIFNHIFFHEGNNMQLFQWYSTFYQRITGQKFGCK